MADYPKTWTDEQRGRFQNVSSLLGIDGLWDRGRFIHVAGTNGKGSVCAFLSAMLQKAGYRVGMFTSPHLYSETERISIDGVQIGGAELDALMAEAHTRAPDANRFEHYMYAALNHLQDTDISIIEAGIGGSMDCTSIVQPLMCICTAIGLDHSSLLGDNIESIARQKAGIAKPGVPFVLYPELDVEAHDALLEECERQEAMVFDLANGEVSYRVDGELVLLTMSADGLALADAHIGLQGGHQALNGATAAYAAWLLNACGLMVKPADIIFGLVAVNWPGRMQLLRGQKDAARTAGSSETNGGNNTDSEPDILLDGAHNPQAARALSRAVREHYPGRKVALLTAIMKDKPYEQVAAELADMTEHVVCTCADKERGLPASEYAKHFGNAQHEEDPQAALELAKRLAGEGGLVVVCGSLYLPGFIKGVGE